MLSSQQTEMTILKPCLPKITEEVYQKIFSLRDKFGKAYRDITLYDYQKEVSNAIIRSVLENKGETVVIEFSRQSGKTEVVCITVSFLQLFIQELLLKFKGENIPEFNVGVFAPQKEQSKTDFDRIKQILRNELLTKDFLISFSEANGNTVRLSNQNTIYCFSASLGSHTESKTMNVIILEEAQGIETEKIENTIEPMGANTNATIIYIGTAGYKKCKFLEKVEGASQKYIVDFRRVVKEKLERYRQTGYEKELNYFHFLQTVLVGRGIKIETPEELINLDLSLVDNDAFKTQYALQWMLEKGQYITSERLMLLQGNYEIIKSSRDLEVFVGVDFGKMHDSTVVTVGDTSGRILCWKEMVGEDYETQFLAILNFLSNFKVKSICYDSTANQDMMGDRFKRTMRNMDVRVTGVNFASLKSELFKNMDFMMRPVYGPTGDKVNDAFLKFPKTDCPEKERFVKQFLDLQKEVNDKGVWKCNAPEGTDYFDDYCSSAALYIWNFKFYGDIQSNSMRDTESHYDAIQLRKKIATNQLTWQDKFNLGYLRRVT